MKYSLDISNFLEEQLLETSLWNSRKVMSFVYREQGQKKDLHAMELHRAPLSSNSSST